MNILAIETSCDETAIALVKANGGLSNRQSLPRFEILKNLVASQIKIHQPYGGVVPNLAKREHLKNLPVLFDKILTEKIDLIAVTVGPGLEPALWTGINFAKEIKKQLKAPILGVSHLDGHLYSFLLSQKKVELKFPAIALIISGGHTILIKMDSLIKFKKIGETRDDAVGEAFDKVARLLNLPYPGGPEIERLAKFGNSNAINFPRPMIHQKNYDFSFSGLKTSVLYYLKNKKDENLANVAASFQSTAFDVLISKTLRAAKEFDAKSIFVSGGVSANKTLKKEFQKSLKKKFVVAKKPTLNFTKFPTDNAAMIAAAGYINFLQKKNRRLIARSDINI